MGVDDAERAAFLAEWRAKNPPRPCAEEWRQQAHQRRMESLMADPKDTGKEQRDEPVSLAPLNPEEALRALLAVKPDAADGEQPADG